MTRTLTDAAETFTGASLVTTTFPTTRGLSRAGYDTHEVDAFLVRSAAAVDGLISRLTAAERQLADSQAEIARLRDRIDRDSRTEEVQQAVSILTSAQITADATVAHADEYSARVMTEAQQLYEETRRNAAILEQETQDKAKAVYEDAVLRVEAYRAGERGALGAADRGHCRRSAASRRADRVSAHPAGRRTGAVGGVPRRVARSPRRGVRARQSCRSECGERPRRGP